MPGESDDAATRVELELGHLRKAVRCIEAVKREPGKAV
jgi:hypothetical protein